MNEWQQWLVLVAAWAVYEMVHSALASLRMKGWVADRWPEVVPWYRLLFNLSAGLLLLPISWLTLAWLNEPWWRFEGGWLWASWVLDALVCLAF